MGNRITALQNLKKRGADANPNGRPKREWTWAGLIEQAVEENLTTKDGVLTEKAKMFIAKKLVRMAIDGDILAIKEIANRMDGMPKQATELSTKDDKPLIIIGYGHKRTDTASDKTKDGS